MRILMVCQRYWPERWQITEVCEELVARGHDVTVLTGIPNYPTGIVPEDYLNGKNRSQVKNGVRIVRCEETPRTAGVIGLAKNYFSFPKAAEAKLVELDEHYDIVFSYQLSPVFMALPAIEAKKRFNAPLVLYCCDIWPDAVMAMLPRGMGFLMPLVKSICSRIYRSCDAIATNSNAYVDCMESVHGVDRSVCKYVPQYAEDGYLSMDLAARSSGKTRFMVMGNIGRLQHMPSVLEAVNRIKGRDDFELHIVGTGSVIGACERYVEENLLSDKVIFHGRHPFEEMPDFYRMADCCILTLNVPGAPWISSTLPSRLQGYMAAGKPILAAISGSAAEVIAESGCGRAVPAGDSAGLAALMEDFIDNRGAYEECGEKGRAYFKANFTKDRYMDEIESLLLAASRIDER